VVTHSKRLPNSRLHDARVEHGWSQQKLAELLGTTPVSISRWENGVNHPFPYFQERMCKVFGKTPAELGLLPSPDEAGESLQSQDESPPAPGVSRINTIPNMRNPFFIGREDLLVALHERLSKTRAAALTQAQALYGIGGIGKTQTATEYAFRYSDEYTHLLWMRAATRETLVADMLMLAERLDLPEKNQQDQQRVVEAVKGWLAEHEGWLLIMDNADDLPTVREFLPSNHKGHIIFTTRAQASGAIAASIEVERLSPNDGTLLLLRWTKRLAIDAPLDQALPTERAAAERIVQEMDGLPLAIVQAGAYIEETGCTLEDYLHLYQTHCKELLGRHSRLSLDYPETVASTWAVSFEKIEQESPAAADVLRLCAYLAPDAIPEELLTRGAAELGDLPGAAVRNLFKLNEALEVLRRYSLVRRDADTHQLTIHRLVQIVHRESMDHETQRAWAERTVRVVNAAFPPEASYSTGAHYKDYLPHAQECARLIEQYHLSFPKAAQLLFQAGAFSYFYNFYAQSQALHTQALAIREQVLGPEHPDVAESLNRLGMLARVREDYSQAEELYRRTLAIREKVLGPEHPAVAESFNNLGVLYRNQGKYEQAEPFLQRALKIHQQSSGHEHTQTLLAIFNLGKLYTEQRKYKQAEERLQQALAGFERVLKPGHPLIAKNLSLLAKLSYDQGNHGQAEQLWEQALAQLEKTLGMEHYSLAEVLNNLAKISFAQGHYTEAQSFCERALSICERVLGSEHSETITYREHLARIVSKREAEQNG
jgi:tetratricopeptide (TPR) repeat protein/transcriptional regulator with XRE-family HTH domain